MKIHSVECPACKKYFNSEFGVCPFCGNVYTEEVQQPTKPRTEGRKKSRRTAIIVGAVAAVVLVSVISIVAIKSSFFGILKQRGMGTSSDDAVASRESSSDDAVASHESSSDDIAVTQYANLLNMGFACEIEGEMYYSDWKTGIYINKESDAELFIEGRYREMCLLDDKLFCVEDYYEESERYGLSESNQLVMIDMKTKDKEVVFGPTSRMNMITPCNCVNGKIYFKLNEDFLYTVDKAGEVTDIGVPYVKGVTNDGIYTARYGDKGLRLLSFNKEEKQVFPSLDSYMVWIRLDLNDILYLNLSSDELEKDRIVKFDRKNGTMEDFLYQNDYGTLKYLNYFDGKIYMTFDNDGITYVCKTGVDGASISLLSPLVDEEMYSGVISIAGSRICVSFPFRWEGTYILDVVEDPIVSVQKFLRKVSNSEQRERAVLNYFGLL